MKLLFSLILILSPLDIPVGKVSSTIIVEDDMVFWGDVTNKTACIIGLDFKNNTYRIYLLHDATIDQFVEIIISFGGIKKTNNTIYFSDIATGLKMTGKLTGNNIRFVDGMSFLKNVKFEQSESNDTIEIPISYTFETAEMKREKLHYEIRSIDKIM